MWVHEVTWDHSHQKHPVCVCMPMGDLKECGFTPKTSFWTPPKLPLQCFSMPSLEVSLECLWVLFEAAFHGCRKEASSLWLRKGEKGCIAAWSGPGGGAITPPAPSSQEGCLHPLGIWAPFSVHSCTPIAGIEERAMRWSGTPNRYDRYAAEQLFQGTPGKRSFVDYALATWRLTLSSQPQSPEGSSALTA